ncbi:uncharacterized protein LOC116345200 [Contarinia nasturtii]|uniref:uncharacterized protein LOC116345200 n=1 Tax=Contarinia nasturtii TaxID=265458 RepID=UPI0012D398EC|nr:uncharacterized protein LOC116345200 [Contarinia nasturtii]
MTISALILFIFLIVYNLALQEHEERDFESLFISTWFYFNMATVSLPMINVIPDIEWERRCTKICLQCLTFLLSETSIYMSIMILGNELIVHKVKEPYYMFCIIGAGTFAISNALFHLSIIYYDAKDERLLHKTPFIIVKVLCCISIITLGGISIIFGCESDIEAQVVYRTPLHVVAFYAVTILSVGCSTLKLANRFNILEYCSNLIVMFSPILWIMYMTRELKKVKTIDQNLRTMGVAFGLFDRERHDFGEYYRKWQKDNLSLNSWDMLDFVMLFPIMFSFGQYLQYVWNEKNIAKDRSSLLNTKLHTVQSQ